MNPKSRLIGSVLDMVELMNVGGTYHVYKV